MAKMFEVPELLQVAVEDERSGVAFYSVLAEKAESDALRRTYAELAEQERGHQAHFEEMLRTLGEHRPPELHDGEYAAYLNALTTSRAFPDADSARAQAERCADDKASLEIATRMERDTLGLLNEMRSMVSERNRETVDEIIIEEQSHLVALTEAWQQLR